MDELIKIEITKPEIPENWDYNSENKKFDELIYGWRRFTIDVISDLWIFYNKLKVQGERRDLSQNYDKLPTWLEWIELKGISENTPLNHFKRLGWIKGKPHVSNNSGENEWYTPSEIIDSAKKTMGNIDLDPASSEIANKNIKAEQIFTEKDNGLEKKWIGNIWMNPPYAQPLINKFSDKFISELSNIKQACVLVNNATETIWLQNMMKECNAICFIKGRVKFIDIKGNASGSPLQGQVILYFGKNIKGFYNNFKEFGICMMRIEEK